MADHLILSLQSPPPSLSSSLHRRCALSRRLPNGIRFSVSQFQFSFQLKFLHCISPSKSSSFSSPSPNFATEKFDLVSTTQLKDGSYVFRFGDASEIEKNLEIEAKIKATESDTSFNNVIKIKDRKKVRSYTKRKKEPSSSVIVLQKEEDKVESKVVSVAEETIPSSSIDDKLISEKVSVNEIREFERNENHVEVQARLKTSTSQYDSKLYDHHLKEVAHVSTIELDDNLDVVEPAATSTVSSDELISTSEATNHSVEEITKPPIIDTPEVNDEGDIELDDHLDVVEPTATSTVSSDELISTSEAANHSVEEINKPPIIDMLEVVNDEGNVSSTREDCSLSNTKTNNGSSLSKTTTEDEDLQLPTPETINLESIEFVSKAFCLDSGVASLQNPFKSTLAGGEDAYFISGQNWLGVADGVSQWSFEGIIRGTYAQELMSNCQKIISNETDPLQVLYKSVNETKSTGSSTALIAHLHNNELHIANIGDSGFMVIRNNKVLQKSSPMFHHFCFPLRITQSDDVLKLAEVYNVTLEEGDVVITATDGLFDNLYEKEIVSIVCKSLEQSLEPKKIAELVAAKAQEVGRSEKERTPFEDEAKEEGYGGYKGGKLDDVTVIVSLVKTVCV